MGNEIETVTMRSMTYETENKNEYETYEPGELPVLEVSDVLLRYQGVEVVVVRLEPGDVHRVRVHGGF